MNNLIDIIPELIFAVFSMACLLIVAGFRYKIKISLIISITFTLTLVGANILMVYFINNFNLEDWYLVTIFIPEAILTWFLGKRRSVSLVAAILNAFLAAYSIVLLRNIILTTIINDVLEYIVYFLSFPFIILYLIKIYIPLHNEIEKFSQERIGLLILYALFLIAEFYFYGVVVRDSELHVLRLEIFGIAILSVYVISIVILMILIKSNNDSVYKEASNKILKNEIKYIREEAKLQESKNEELKILRHDMRHILYSLSTLIHNKNNDEALELINKYIEEIDLTKETKFTNDIFINSTLVYFFNKCEKDNIKLNISINDIEDCLKIPSAEVAVVISNAIENAIKATKELYDNRIIDFKFINNNGRLILNVENGYQNEILRSKDGTPISNNEGHGIGSESIKTFVKKYNLVLNYDITNDKFRLTIIF